MTRKNFEVLNKVTKTINSIMDYPVLLEKVMDLALETVNAERGAIILEDANNLEFAVARDISKENLKALADLSSSVVRKVITEGKPILLHDVQDDQRFKEAKSVVKHDIRSVLCVPLTSRGKLSGVIYADTRSRRGVFTSEELEFLAAFSDQAGIAIENARLHSMLAQENVHLKQELMHENLFSNIVGRSASMQRVFDILRKILNSNVPVLISGETGTGKEQVARALHYNGPRKDARFVPIYCGSLPLALFESELFGYKKGAFTGASQDKKGFFDEANGGTLFLDEITDISPDVQAKLLRVLQEQEFFRIGDTSPRRVDVRVISATNKNIETEIKNNRFREDLFYRLNVVRVELPPLRERKGDISLLSGHFLTKSAKESGKKTEGFTPEALELMENYSWPGNVRELENIVSRAVALASNRLITPDLLGITQPQKKSPPDPGFDKSYREALKHFESEYILDVLEKCKGNRKLAAQRMGISLRNLQYKLRDIQDEEKA